MKVVGESCRMQRCIMEDGDAEMKVCAAAKVVKSLVQA
jgi:hypothetical protein